ncbi:uncharacterized protein PG986_007595 [Apiospora aurea]|uniref:Uncharacterized protein n=1 Tax=Apiospora aurea TaxID=335848 RepID=A0ABR1QD21_9PEZI
MCLNVEREAAKTMALLLEWAETVVLGDYDEWALAGEDAFGELCVLVAISATGWVSKKASTP